MGLKRVRKSSQKSRVISDDAYQYSLAISISVRERRKISVHVMQQGPETRQQKAIYLHRD